jgi:hypothetical protein
MKLFTIFIGFIIASGTAFAAFDDSDEDILKSQADEELLIQTQSDITAGKFNVGVEKDAQINADILLQAISDTALNGEPEVQQNALQALDRLENKNLELAARVQAEAIRRTILKKDALGMLKTASNDDSLIATYFFKALFKTLDKKSVYTLLTNADVFTENSWRSLISWTKSRYPQWAQMLIPSEKAAPTVTNDIIKDVFNFEPSNQYASGKYYKKPRVFMFCRSVREYPCLMVMKDGDGNVWRDAKGSVWSQPALGYSHHKLPATKPNGNSPAGIQRIDGVMPTADSTLTYGKFRRLILNFVGEGKNESFTKLLIPASSYNSDWWKQASVARDIGRGALRIHGAGWFSLKSSPWYTFVPTSGCIAKREGSYDGTKFVDQRLFLDELMRISGLEVKAENEEKITALLYLIEIDAKKAPVKLADLQAIGLF